MSVKSVVATLGLALLPVLTQAANAPRPTLLAAIQSYNQQILTDRVHLQEIASRYLSSDELSEDEFNWLKKTAEYYQLQPRQRGDQSFFKALQARMDVIPASLLLATALAETGTQPDSTQQRNPFGIGSSNSELEAVQHYAQQLNTDPAYAAFRDSRSRLRDSKQRMRGSLLTAAFSGNSPWGRQQETRLLRLIRLNQLEKFD